MIDRDDSTARLVRECEVYTRYLIGRPPGDYVTGKYIAFYQSAAAAIPDPDNALDCLLLWCSRFSPAMTSLADSYASRFRKTSPLRRKIVLTLAILECCPDASRWIDSVDRGPLVVIYLRMACRAACYALAVLLSIVIFGPVHLCVPRPARCDEGVPR